MKRPLLTSGLLAVLLATGLAACSREDTNSIAVPEPNSPTSTTAPDTTTTTPPATTPDTNNTTSNTTGTTSTSGTTSTTDATSQADTNRNADTAGRTTGQAIDNATLTGKVKAALASDAGLKTLTLNVDSNDGVVTVSGTVPSQQMSDSVNQVVRGVEGVRSVQNNVTVRP
ncbi:BON domain-containing protein [Chitinimonas lacunae]|uniref:BON domain-containing protein n=1 Tax=Chitinimonas lacunae TaxID=1963018 RepID=A0ABV8MJW0_9NEIS